MKNLSCFLMILAVILFGGMCFTVGYNYRDMLCGIEHAGYSAPASLAFLAAVPFAVGIIACVVLAVVVRRFGKE